MLMRHVSIPRGVTAFRPPERLPVTIRSRYSTQQHLLFLRTVPLSIHQHLTVKLQRPVNVLTRGVLTEFV
ncbi:hypothetical protein HanIR_Chr04g0198031 [Helianthus annuus]|nr:hypothetical protein HanIR_Chr04g0198031 [Helianthus annuus]